MTRVNWLIPGKIYLKWASKWAQRKGPIDQFNKNTCPRKHSSETEAPIILTRGWSNWIHSFWLHLSPLPCFPTLIHRVCWVGWDRDTKWTIFLDILLASIETLSSGWAVLGTFAFPIHPGWGKPPLVKYYLVLVDVSLIFFFVLLFWVISHFANSQKLIQASSHPEVGQPGIVHRYTLPRVGQDSKT